MKIKTGKSTGLCQLCGKQSELTSEHLPQKGLYPKAIRHRISNMNVIRACYECNNSQNVADELLKVFVGLVANSPWRRDIVEGVDATVRKNRRIATMLQSGTRLEVVESPSGARDARIFKLPQEYTPQLISALERIVRALYFQEYGEVLVERHVLGVFHPDGIDNELKLNLDKALHEAKWRSVNADSIKYCFTAVRQGRPVCVINLFESVELYFSLVERKGSPEIPSIA